jgi:hypothetical protein
MTKKNVKTTQTEETGYTYLGPTVRGMIYHGSFYTGTRAEVEKQLSTVIAKYPRIKDFIIADSDLATERVKIKTEGTWSNKIYKDLVSQMKK